MHVRSCCFAFFFFFFFFDVLVAVRVVGSYLNYILRTKGTLNLYLKTSVKEQE